MSELAVLGCEITISSTAGTISATSIEPSNQPSQDNLAGEKGIYFDKITVAISGVTITSPVTGTTGTGTLVSDSIDIAGTASNIQDINGKYAVQKGDQGTKTCTFDFTTTSSPPETIQVQLPVIVTVTDAGQTDISAT